MAETIDQPAQRARRPGGVMMCFTASRATGVTADVTAQMAGFSLTLCTEGVLEDCIRL